MCSVRFAAAMFFGGLMVFGAGGVSGQDYPNKPIRLLATVVGGSGDFVARLVANGISGRLGQPIIVDNRPTLLSAEIVSKAPPDGYTLIVASSGLWVAPILQKTPYQMEDFAPITMVGKSPLILVVHPSVAANSVKELIALAKAKPGVLNYSSGPLGSPSHLAPELFKSMAGVNIVRIGYVGGGLMMTAVLGGEVQLYFTSPTAGMPHIKTGKLRALGMTGTEPSALTPGIPPIASGLPGYEVIAPDAVYAPAKTPEARINRLYQEIARYIATPEAKALVLSIGAEPVANTPTDFAALIKADVAKMGKVIREAGLGG